METAGLVLPLVCNEFRRGGRLLELRSRPDGPPQMVLETTGELPATFTPADRLPFPDGRTAGELVKDIAEDLHGDELKLARAYLATWPKGPQIIP